MKRHLLHGALFGACVLTNFADASVYQSLQDLQLKEVALDNATQTAVQQKLNEELDQALAQTDLSAHERAELEALRAAGVRAIAVAADSTSAKTYSIGFYDRKNNILYVGANVDGADVKTLVKSVVTFTDGQKPTITNTGIWPAALSTSGTPSSPQTDKNVVQMTMGTGYLPLVAVQDYPDIFQLTSSGFVSAGASVPTGETHYTSLTIKDANSVTMRTHPAGMVAASTDLGQFVVVAVPDGTPKLATVVVDTKGGTVDPVKDVLVALETVIPADKPVNKFVIKTLEDSDAFRDAVARVITEQGVVDTGAVKQPDTKNQVLAEVKKADKTVLLTAQAELGVDPVKLAGVLDEAKVRAVAELDSVFNTAGNLDDTATKDAINAAIVNLLKDATTGALPDNLTTGADGGLVGGLVWALRTGTDADDANALRDKFKAGASSVKDAFDALVDGGVKTKPVDTFAAGLVAVDAVGEALVKKTADSGDNLVFEGGSDTNGINQRFIKAGEAAFAAAGGAVASVAALTGANQGNLGAAVADTTPANKKIDAIAKINAPADAAAAAGVADGLVIADDPVNGSNAAIQAVLGWGIRSMTMNSTATEIQTSMKDVLTALQGATNTAGAATAKGAVKAINDDVDGATITPATGDSDKPVFNALQTIIKNAIKAGTAAVTEAFTTNVLKDKDSKTIEAASAALLDLTATGGDVDATRFNTVADLAGGKTAVDAADEVKAGPQGADNIQASVVAAVEGAAGWGVNQAVVSASEPRSWQMTADGNEGIHRGIAILSSGTAFAQLDPDDISTAGTKAFVLSDKLTPVTDQLVKGVNGVVAALFANGAAQPMDSALLDVDNVVMHYDDQLQRVFIGLPNVGRGKKKGAALADGIEPGNDKDGGVISVLVMRVDDKNAVKVAPVFANPANDKLANDSKGLIGFYHAAGGDNLRASVKNLKTMHTSTNKTYLILNGGVSKYDNSSEKALKDPTQNELLKVASWVYALPLVDATSGLAATESAIGQLGKNQADKKLAFELRDGAADKAPAVDQAKEFVNFDAANEVPLVVGGDPRFLGDATNTAKAINYMEVVGDSVRVSTEDAVYQSTALFDEVGNITSWTKWQKVAGNNAARVFGVNDTAGTMQFLSTDGKNVSTTADGQSANTAATSNNLTDVLAQIFPNGIYKIVNFGPDTVGFDGNLNMMVAVGGDRVALIDTTAAAAVGSFSIETGGGAGNVFVYGGSDLSALGLGGANAADLAAIEPLTTAEVLRAADDDLGYLFVGGMKGLARLEGTAGTTNANKGWVKSDGTTLKELDKLLNNKFPGAVNGDDYTFVAADPAWSNKFVTGISGRNKKLCVATLANGVTETDEITVADSAKLTGDDKNVAPISAVGVANDVVVVGGFSDRSLTADATKSAVVIAGSNGLFVARSDALTPALPDVLTRVEGIDSPLAPLALEYLSAQDLNLAQGELFVLAADRNGNQAKIYRFAVNAAAGSLADVLKPLQAYDATAGAAASLDPIDLGVFTRSFSTDGAMIMTARGRTVSNTNLTDVIALEGADAAKSNTLVGQIDIGDASTTTMSFAPVKDLASGRWVVPGDFGARVVND